MNALGWLVLGLLIGWAIEFAIDFLYWRKKALAEQFLQYFDGFSIGSNDMTQLTLNLDRDSGLVSESFDERNPAVKVMLHLAISACRKQNQMALTPYSVSPRLTDQILEPKPMKYSGTFTPNLLAGIMCPSS